MHIDPWNITRVVLVYCLHIMINDVDCWLNN